MYSRATLITTPSRNATFHYHNGYVLIRLPERFVVHTCCHCWTLSPTSPAHKVESCSSRCSGSKTPPRPALTGFPLLLSMNVQSVFHPCLHRPLCCPIQTSEVPFSKSITADGMAKVRWPRCASVAVIARNTTFTYKGRAVDTRQVARELGVRYVLEGSVQKAGQRIRVTAQLIEANSGNHVWAEKYDRELEDLFVVQDEITQGIFAALKTHLLLAEAELAQRKPPQSLDAWGYTVRAWAKWHYITPENFVDVVALARRAIDLQPDYGPAHAILSAALGFGSFAAFSDDLKEMGRELLAEARKAVELDGDNPDVLLAAGVSNFFLGLLKRSHGLLERAVELNPNNAMACAAFGKSLALFGRPDEGVKLIERAMRLSPRDPQTYLFQAWLGLCHFFAGRFDEAIQWSERSSWAKPRYVELWLNMAAALAEAGRPEEAGRAIRKARELVPRLSLAIFRRAYADGTLWPKFIDGVRKAGMPEE